MSAQPMFDSHRYVKKLVAGGFSIQQAEVLAREQMNIIHDGLATRQQVTELDHKVTELDHKVTELDHKFTNEFLNLRKDMEHGFAQVDSRFVNVENRFLQLENRLIIKLGSIMVAVVAVVGVLLKLI